MEHSVRACYIKAGTRRSKCAGNVKCLSRYYLSLDLVLDLGCGAGLDLYFYAKSVGKNGKVYGLDISTDMIEKAGTNMESMGISNTEFICGSLDELPFNWQKYFKEFI